MGDAEATGRYDVGHRVVDSPVGRLLLVSSSTGLVRVAFEREGHASVLETLTTSLGPDVRREARWLDVVARRLDAYFAGGGAVVDVPSDLSSTTGFRAAVLRFLPTIPPGSTLTYAQVAERVGSPRAVRAVGTACATNPLPIVVPCHRVVRSDGTLGGYLGGLEAKAQLLDLERRG